jgi:hypothetical protein
LRHGRGSEIFGISRKSLARIWSAEAPIHGCVLLVAVTGEYVLSSGKLLSSIWSVERSRSYVFCLG